MKKFWALIILALIILPAQVQAVEFPVTSPFGWRIHPISGEWKFHTGVDLGYEYGAYIGSLFDGQVVLAENLGDGYGNQVLIYHPAIDAYTRYAHCSTLYVTAGQMVTAGQIISQVGSSGYSTGPHLHLEYIINVDGVYQYADPLSLWQ
ncbi:MAG: M23 family metallopeptidase [Selenomonadaceae bacterium]|nr:M23 family metallopeptidase [Selenomonadaceae bacterium]MBQ7493230.1 M23 family metallopeptidase [Selenomonadaceae bacterium]